MYPEKFPPHGISMGITEITEITISDSPLAGSYCNPLGKNVWTKVVCNE